MISLAFLAFFITLLTPDAPRPLPVPSEQVFRYTSPDASVVAVLNLHAVRQLLDKFEAFERQPFVQKVSDIAGEVRSLRRAIDQQLTSLRDRLGFDPLTRLDHVTFSLQYNDRKENVFVTLGGRFTSVELRSLATMVGLGPEIQPQRLGGWLAYVSEGRLRPTVALSPEGMICLAHPEVIRDLLDGKAKPSAFARQIASQHRLEDAGFLAVDLLDQEIRRRFLPRGIARLLLRGLTTVSFGVHSQGTQTTARSTPDAKVRIRLLLEMLGEWASSSHHLVTGGFKLAEALLEMEGRIPPPMARLLKHKDEIRKFIQQQIFKMPLGHKIVSAQDSDTLLVDGRINVLLIAAILGGFSAYSFAAKSSRVSQGQTSVPRARPYRGRTSPSKVDRRMPPPPSPVSQPAPPTTQPRR